MGPTFSIHISLPQVYYVHIFFNSTSILHGKRLYYWSSLTKGHILIASGQVPKTSITPFILGIPYFL